MKKILLSVFGLAVLSLAVAPHTPILITAASVIITTTTASAASFPRLWPFFFTFTKRKGFCASGDGHASIHSFGPIPTPTAPSPPLPPEPSRPASTAIIGTETGVTSGNWPSHPDNSNPSASDTQLVSSRLGVERPQPE